MSEKFTAEFINEQRKIAENAIDTPWKSDNCVVSEYDHEITIFAPWGGRVKAGNVETYADYRGAQIAKLYHQGKNAAVVTEGQAVANAAYIIAAANNYPAAMDEIERLRKKVERASVLLGLERAARLTVEERLKSLRSQYDIWRELNPDNDDNEEDKGISMDTLTEAVTNVLRMIEGWTGDVETAAVLLEEIRAELERGLGATVEPKELTPEEKREAKEFLDDLFLGGKA